MLGWLLGPDGDRLEVRLLEITEDNVLVPDCIRAEDWLIEDDNEVIGELVPRLPR